MCFIILKAGSPSTLGMVGLDKLAAPDSIECGLMIIWFLFDRKLVFTVSQTGLLLFYF